jgi:hypothetical protein
MATKKPIESATFQITLKDNFSKNLKLMEKNLSTFERRLNSVDRKAAHIFGRVNKAGGMGGGVRGRAGYGGFRGGGAGGFAMNALSSFTGFTAANAIGQITDATKEAVAWAVRLGSEWQQTNIAFTTMLGSRQHAKDTLRDLSSFAEITPFKQNEVVQGARQMLAYGFDPDAMTENMRMLGDVASGVHKPLSDIVYVYGTLRTQGRAYSRDLFQFGMRGIPIYEALSETLGKSGEEIKEMTRDGQIGFKEIENAFKHMTKEGSRFGGLMAEQAKSLGGRWETFQDKVENMARRWSTKNIVPGLTEMLKGINEMLPGMRTATDIYFEQEKALSKDEKSLRTLTGRYQDLTHTSVKTKDQQEELKKVMNDIALIAPSLVTSWDDYGNAMAVATGKTESFIRKNQAWLNEMNKESMHDQIMELQTLSSQRTIAKNELASGFSRSFFSRGDGTWEEQAKRAKEWQRRMFGLSEKEKKERKEFLNTYQDDAKGYGKERAIVAEMMRLMGISKGKDLPDDIRRQLDYFGIPIENDFDPYKKFGKPAKQNPFGDEDGTDGMSGVEKIRSQTRNIIVNITKVVGEIKYEKYETSERDMTQRVSRALVAAVNDVNLVS